MEQEILFRAKSVSSNEWVYGNFIHSKRFKGCSNEYRIHEQDTGIESDIDKETVGIFSTILDKNKTKMFHGDIFKLGAEKGLFEVRFIHGCSLAYKNGKQYGILAELKECFLEVVGNVTDNPEMLNE